MNINQQTTNNKQQSAISNQQSAISNRKLKKLKTNQSAK